MSIISEIESIYKWRGKIEHDHEKLLIIKSTQSKSSDLIEYVKKNHPYECPEVLITNVSTHDLAGNLELPIKSIDKASFQQVVAGNTDYLTWVRETLRKDV